MKSSDVFGWFLVTKNLDWRAPPNNLIVLKSWYVVMEFTGCLKNFNNSPKTSIFFTNHRYLQQLTTESCLTAELKQPSVPSPPAVYWVTQYWVSNETRPLSCAQLSKCLFFGTVQRATGGRKKKKRFSELLNCKNFTPKFHQWNY